MTSTPKLTKHVQDNDSPTTSPLSGQGPGGHKPSFKSTTKLARRARSFKDDFLGKISQMRNPAHSLRSHSPKPPPLPPPMDSNTTYKGPIQELDDLWRQIQIALKHLKDVVKKEKLEMLPGNGTIILDTVWLMNLAVKSAVASNLSNTIISATNHMYQSVSRLIKLCDDALIDSKSAALSPDNVDEIVGQVEEAVFDLIKLAQEKITNQSTSTVSSKPKSYTTANLDVPTQRNSLPDIPLTPREREILQQTSYDSLLCVRNSHSSESILRDATPANMPPPKPPLPNRVLFVSHSEPNSCTTPPPPLPPKKRNFKMDRFSNEFYSTKKSPIASSLERMSIRSKSPEDSISLLSVSAGSLDSMLNNSRGEDDEEEEEEEEEEIKAIMMEPTYDNEVNYTTNDLIFSPNNNSSWEDSSSCSNISNNKQNESNTICVNDYHRLSNTDSGIMSGSSQSYRSSHSKCYSQQNWNVKEQKLAEVTTVVSTKTSLTSCSSSSSSMSTFIQMLSPNKDEVDFCFGIEGDVLPPAIPVKTRKKQDRQPSPYDNVPENNLGGEILVSCHMHQSPHQHLSNSLVVCGDGSKPPPLPPKKKHMFQSVAYSVMAYMEMFGNCSHANEQEFMRHSVHMVQQSQWLQQQLSTLHQQEQHHSCSFSTSATSSRSFSHIQALNVPSSGTEQKRVPSPLCATPAILPSTNVTPPSLPPKQRTSRTSTPPTTSSSTSTLETKSPMKILPDLLEHTSTPTTTSSTTTTTTNNDVSPIKISENLNNNVDGNVDVNSCEIDLIEELTVDQWLIIKKPEEDGPDIRGGPIDALIIQATKAAKNGVFTYQEAFLTTYRTFITPFDLINKLIRRYNHYYYQPDKKPRSREAFALIVRVVSDLTCSDLDEALQCKLMNFVQQLIACGELTLAKALRVKHLEKHELKQLNLKLTANNTIVTSLTLSSRNFTLLDFKSDELAEQMTLLDSDLFMKIEIPEVLIWAQEQNEERSPNLTKFTEHFNKMSYWARTKILTAEFKDLREKYFLKFIKIMKHLRKINNFNSYLALLSALDSAPVRRLEWQKHVQDGLKEYCALIDSSSSFRAYRQALAETQPPCIPYIGLVLQDLTFVHIGNSDVLPNNTINFSKRWQQFNIVENMKKFKKGMYTFKRNDRIMQFFQNFDDFIGEDAMWQLSESIKPRGTKKPA